MQYLIDLRDQIMTGYGPQVFQVARALGILVIGWIVALAAQAFVRAALKKTTLDNRLAKWVLGEKKEESVEVERWVGKTVYYLLLLFVLVAFLNALNLGAVSEPLTALLNKVFSFLPNIAGALLLVGVAWILASVLRRVVSTALDMARLDERIGGEAGLEDGKRPGLAKTVSDAVYWLVFLLFLPNILEALSLRGLLLPVQGLIDRILTYLPNIVAAAVILAVGWFIARIVQRIVVNLLTAVGVDALGRRVGLDAALGTMTLSGLLGMIVYVVILIPVIVSSLNALALEAVTRPASDMLGKIMGSVPGIFAAVILLVLAFVVGRLVASLVTNILAGAGFNNILAKLGISSTSQPNTQLQRSPSALVGTLILTAIMLFGSIEAANLLGFASLAALVSSFVEFAGQVVLGLIVFAIGLFLANLAARTIRASGATQPALLSLAARLAIIVLSGAIALRQMGLANEIIELAFGLLLGAIAVAVAISFGLGGRDAAAQQIDSWVKSLKSK